MAYKVFTGDNINILRSLADNSIDSVVTDAPYGLGKEPDAAKVLADWVTKGYHEIRGKGFMGKEWDAFVPQPLFWKEVFRVLKPGGHVLCFFGTRTYDWGVMAMRLAGFEIRDQIGWVFGSGFPKSLDVSKAIDKKEGRQMAWFGPWLRIERQQRGIAQKDLAVHFPSKTGGLTGCVANWELGLNIPTEQQFNKLCEVLNLPFEYLEDLERVVIGTKETSKLAFAPGQGYDRQSTVLNITAPTSEAAQQWEGWGTALKPAWEPIVVARKPLEGTVAENVMKWGTGAVNIDGCRVGADQEGMGRWPANLIHDGSEEVIGLFPDVRSGSPVSGNEPSQTGQANTYGLYGRVPFSSHNDEGSAARFFYCAKAGKEDRDEGLEDFELRSNIHPTVKPTDLMRWLVRLVTPPGGTVLDPFAGSGSTGKACEIEGFDSVLMEMCEEYIPIIHARCDFAAKNRAKYFMKKEDAKAFDPKQYSLF